MNEVDEKRARVRRSAKQWRALIEKFRASGLSRAQFCKTHDVAPSSFGKALQRHQGRAHTSTGGLPVAVSAEAAAFVPLSVPVAADGGWDVEVQLSASVFIRLRTR
jgi:hypothetical protein